ncbi:MAG TPA: FAD-dependent oxidoreductase [Solirubrobacteraceae bacterium]|jgi:sulfide:quinone oxidoreductase
MSPQRRPHVVIAGGGIAGVETVLALRALAGARVSIELLTPEPDLVMRPLAVAAPFGTADVTRYPLEAICRNQNVHLRREPLEYVDVARRRVETASGARVDFDMLVLAVGARRRDALPGSLTFDGDAGIRGFRQILDDLRRGAARSLTFVVPDGVTWPLPLYELALMTAEHVRDDDVRLTLVTPEDDPLDVFGLPARERVRALLAERNITLRVGARPLDVTNGILLTSDGAIPAARLVALPRLEGARVPGVPCDRDGFLDVDEHGEVVGAPGVYAAGDGTSQPVKQGGLAAQQADAAAEAIAAACGAPLTPTPFRPQLRAQLLTGTLPWWFRAEAASTSPLWRPAGKVAARYLTPYLTERAPLGLTDHPVLRDVDAPERELIEERQAALDMALTLADDEAAAGEPLLAIRWLEAAEGIAGTLPPEYVEKRRRWAQPTAPDAPRVREPGGAWSVR